MRHLELFSGIGGFRRALDLLAQDGIMPFENAGYSEIDSNATMTYKAIYNIGREEVAMGDIVAYTRKDGGLAARMAALGNIELVTGGFPCQSFSMMGNQAGFEDEDRGQMFFRILDVIDAKNPRYLLLENVKNLFTHDHKKTFQKIEAELKAREYEVFPRIFNSADFHLPQTRNRALIFATKGRVPKNFDAAYTPAAVKALFDAHYTELSTFHYESTLDLLSLDVNDKYFLSERIKPTILADGSANFRSNSEINLRVARPLTASMHKMHRACQDNYYSQDWIESHGEYNPVEHCTKDELARHAIRKLTPQEAFMLQGFPGDFATTAQEAGVSDGALYKQAGNAVSVNTIYAVMYYLIKNKAIK
jgi:DNA (cytosine-5)-methyltransferase 1